MRGEVSAAAEAWYERGRRRSAGEAAARCSSSAARAAAARWRPWCPAGAAVDGQAPAAQFGDGAGDGDAEPGAAVLAGEGGVAERGEGLRQAPPAARRHADAGIGDFEHDAVARGKGRERDLAALRGEAQGILDDIADHALEAEAVAAQRRAGGSARR